MVMRWLHLHQETENPRPFDVKCDLTTFSFLTKTSMQKELQREK